MIIQTSVGDYEYKPYYSDRDPNGEQSGIWPFHNGEPMIYITPGLAVKRESESDSDSETTDRE